jgi:hypothetical protein
MIIANTPFNVWYEVLFSAGRHKKIGGVLSRRKDAHHWFQ